MREKGFLTWYVFHRAERKSLLDLIFISNLVPRSGEIRPHHTLDMISHHHVNILQLVPKRKQRKGVRDIGRERGERGGEEEGEGERQVV